MIALDARTHQDPPWADLLFRELPPGTASVQVSRLVDGWEMGPVPGADSATVTGTVVRILDYAVPLDRDVSWRIRALSADGGLLASEIPPVTIRALSTDHSLAWLSDPLSPTSAIRVRLLADTASTLTRTAPISVATSVTSTLPLGISSGPRSAPRLTVSIEAQTQSDADTLDRLVDAGGVLLLRPGRGIRHRTGLIHLLVGEVQSERPTQGEWEVWALGATEVRPPALPGGSAFRTWADVDPEAATWTLLDTRYATLTWLDLDRGI